MCSIIDTYPGTPQLWASYYFLYEWKALAHVIEYGMLAWKDAGCLICSTGYLPRSHRMQLQQQVIISKCSFDRKGCQDRELSFPA
jgi:hypothetical protein